MKPRPHHRPQAAFTLFEAGMVLALVLILAAVLLPALAKAKRKSSRIDCNNNLKQVGLACRIWAGDNGDVFPAGVLVTNGGCAELAQAGNAVAPFQIMSNELSTPGILICSGDGYNHGDTNRIYATNFHTLTRFNVSYFVGIDATNDAYPMRVLSGDSDLSIAGKPVKSGLLSLGTGDPVEWQSAWHGGNGNIGLADGSVQVATPSTLRALLVRTLLPTNHLAIP